MSNNSLMRAMEAESVSFSRGLWGYVSDEVDEFLDSVAYSLHRYAELVAYNEIRIRQLEEQLAEYINLRDSLQDALLMAKRSSDEHIKAAQREAEAIVAEAKSRAESIVTEAKSQADSIVTEAKSQADSIVTEAKSRADPIVTEAISRHDAMVRQYENLQRDRDHFIADAKALVLRFGSLLDDTVLSAVPLQSPPES